ncbi:hypothetical protein CHISP_0287 [Chitinispirillum alkaliphilum]|nr:hypothetical protein CHISP_0287 [Chitinispirillum alkaliphilum]
MKIVNEIKTAEQMISIFCKSNHSANSLCDECSELLEYSKQRLSACKFGDNKPACRNCKIHCFKPDMRSRIRKVMKFSGPRMIFHNPFATIKHVWNK